MESRSEQSRRALEAATVVKVARAAVKDRIHADASWSTLADVLAGDRPELELELDVARVDGVYVVDLLRAAPGMGAGKSAIVLREVLGIADGFAAGRLRLGELTARQRAALAVGVELRRRRLDDAYVTRIAAGPRWRTSTHTREMRNPA